MTTSGWLVERVRGDRKDFLAVNPDTLTISFWYTWVERSSDALRFAREQDAWAVLEIVYESRNSAQFLARRHEWEG